MSTAIPTRDLAISSRNDSARTQTSVAIDRLRADIISGGLRPTEKLRVQALVQRYQLAASAIREALSRLVTDGLVDVEEQRGFRVSSVSREDLLDLTETRVGIESMAITRAIEYGDVNWEGDIVAAYHRLARYDAGARTQADYAAMVDAHRDFHRSLIAACRSEWLLHFCGVLCEQSERYRYLAHYAAPKNRNSLAEHEALMKAVIARDVGKSCRLISSHLLGTMRTILELDHGLGATPGKSLQPTG